MAKILEKHRGQFPKLNVFVGLNHYYNQNVEDGIQTRTVADIQERGKAPSGAIEPAISL